MYNNNFVSNEQGNQLCGQITEGYIPIGDIYISDGNTVIFSTDGTNSEIGIIDFDCNYTVQVNSDCLNFQVTNQIDVIFRVRKGCEIAVKQFIYSRKEEIIEKVIEKASKEIVRKGLPKLIERLDNND